MQVNEAMLAGRKSAYDSEYYLSSTYPPSFDSEFISLSASQRASMAIMHVFIQCPRLVCLIRHAIMNPDDTAALASAVSHAESLWLLDLPRQVTEFLERTTTTLHVPSAPEIADIATTSLEFDSVQSMILGTRYWMLQNVLCGMIDALHRHFPVETALSLLPGPEEVRRADVDAALNLARSIPWAHSISQKLPLVPLRLHTPLQISIGPWHRTIRQIAASRSSSLTSAAELDLETAFELSRAERMKAYMIEECNRIHHQWDVSTVDETPLLEALDSMAGEKIPDWLPIRVRFEAEDGEMVMKLDYENKTGTFEDRFDLSEKPPKRTDNPFTAEGRWQRDVEVHELPFRTAENKASTLETNTFTFDNSGKNGCMSPSWNSSMRPVDFIHSSGRNLCSTSGWWPETPSTSTILLDSTHKAAAFSRLPPEPAVMYQNDDRHPCLASSWWPQSPKSKTSTSTSTSTPGSSLSDAQRTAFYSPTWVGGHVVEEEESLGTEFEFASLGNG